MCWRSCCARRVSSVVALALCEPSADAIVEVAPGRASERPPGSPVLGFSPARSLIQGLTFVLRARLALGALEATLADVAVRGLSLS